MSLPARVRLIGLLLAVLTVVRPGSAQVVDPAYRFRSMDTGHFVIHFHGETAELAARLATIAEDTWGRFSLRPGVPPPAVTHVVVTDQSESANGYASTLPRNTIVLYVAAPAAASLLNPDDWLETLFVHEFTHVVHLDRAEGWARAARFVFGRAPWTFPNLMLPTWQIEGLATLEETAMHSSPDRGRQHAGDFGVLTAEAGRVGRLEPLDRVGGGLTDWPAGLAPYAYGLTFHDYLAKRFGTTTLLDLSNQTARSLPWLGTRAFGRVFGQGLGSLWRDYQGELTAASTLTSAAESAAVTPLAARQLTRHGFAVSAPRFRRAICAGCPPTILYTVRTPHNRSGLYELAPDTLDTTRVATAFGTRTVAAGSDRALYFDQQELQRNTGLYSDLYRLDPESGDVRALTAGARLMDPDIAPDGQTLAAVRHGIAGQRDLVMVSLTNAAVSPVAIASGPDTRFNVPRWSPDGATIVAERQEPGGSPEIVSVDVASGRTDVIAPHAGLRWATPTWHPDGQRVVAAAAAGDGPFNLVEVTLATGTVRWLTAEPAGATWPAVSPDGATVVYVGYTTEGFDLFERAYVDETSSPAPARPTVPVATRMGTPSVTTRRMPPPHMSVPTPAADYRPWSTLLPTSWTPLFTTASDQYRAGALVGGQDVLGYHAWAASATWRVRDRIGAGGVSGAPDWSASYVYRRWQPQLWTSISRSTSSFATEPDATGLAVPLTVTERLAEAGIVLPVRRLRFSHATQVSVVHSIDEWERASVRTERNRSAARLAWRYSSAQRPGYAISLERGLALGTAVEFVLPALGASGRGGTAAGDVRIYAPGAARHHVVAIRAAGAFTWGDRVVRRAFLLGGGEASRPTGSLSSSAASLLRGFASNTFAGRHVALVNAEYRVPLARPQRGIGAWPFFLHSIHGAVVADAGHTWTDGFNWSHLKTSIGAELSADVILGYWMPLTITGGVARGHDGAGVGRDGVTAYARVGYAF